MESVISCTLGAMSSLKWRRAHRRRRVPESKQQWCTLTLLLENVPDGPIDSNAQWVTDLTHTDSIALEARLRMRLYVAPQILVVGKSASQMLENHKDDVHMLSLALCGTVEVGAGADGCLSMTSREHVMHDLTAPTRAKAANAR